MSLAFVTSALRAGRLFRPQHGGVYVPRLRAQALRTALAVPRFTPSLVLTRSFAAEETDLDPIDLTPEERSHRKGRKESELAEKHKKQKQALFVKRALEQTATKDAVAVEAAKLGFKDVSAVPQNVLADILKMISKKKDMAKKGSAKKEVDFDDDEAADEPVVDEATRLRQQSVYDEFFKPGRVTEEDDEEDEDALDPEEIAEEISSPENVRLADQFKLGDMNRHYPDFTESYNLPKPTNAEERKRRDAAGEVYTELKPVAAHATADASKYYEVPESVTQALSASMLACVKEEFQLTNKLIMVREVGLQVNSVLKQIQQLAAGPKVNRSLTLLLHGSKGAGKSVQLIYSTHFALENGWLVLPANGHGVSSDNGVISRNAADKKLWDQPRLSQQWFETMLSSQAETLKKISLQTSAAKSLANGGSDLFSLVQAAAETPEAAAAAVSPFFAEAKANNSVPVLVVLDNANALDTPSSFFDPDTSFRHIQGDRLNLLANFSDLIKNPPVWGATLFAHSNHHNLSMVKKNKDLADQTFEVTRYTLRELASCAQHYHIHNYLLRNVSDVILGKLMALSGGLPAEMRRVIRGM